MKYFQLLFAIALTTLFVSCVDDVANTGSGIRPSQDAISIHADTFHLKTTNIFVDSICSRQDSFLLGTFYDDKYGMTRAEMMVQVACPEGYVFPENTVPDSVKVYMYYQSFFGDGYSPMQIKVYELNKKTFDYTTPYPSNLNPADYCDKSILLASRIIAAQSPTDSTYSSSTGTYSPYVTFSFGKEFAERFMPRDVNNTYANQTAFTEFFKGMYITTDFGTACMLHVTQIDLYYYYSFTYDNNGRDTTVTASKIFPANSEVRQLNLFEHTDRETVVQDIDSINYIASPANIFTQITIPLGAIHERITTNVDGKQPYLNKMNLQVDVVDYASDAFVQPWSYLLLIKESALERFFSENELPSDASAVLGTIAYNKVDDEYEYYYSYDLSAMITYEIRKDRAEVEDELKMVLVPVTVSTATSNNTTSITAVRHAYLMGGATVRSGKNQTSPMRITTFYSGF